MHVWFPRSLFFMLSGKINDFLILYFKIFQLEDVSMPEEVTQTFRCHTNVTTFPVLNRQQMAKKLKIYLSWNSTSEPIFYLYLIYIVEIVHFISILTVQSAYPTQGELYALLNVVLFFVLEIKSPGLSWKAFKNFNINNNNNNNNKDLNGLMICTTLILYVKFEDRHENASKGQLQ